MDGDTKASCFRWYRLDSVNGLSFRGIRGPYSRLWHCLSSLDADYNGIESLLFLENEFRFLLRLVSTIRLELLHRLYLLRNPE